MEEQVFAEVDRFIGSFNEREGVEPFDLVFIDADKANSPAYCAWSLDRTGPEG